MNPIDLPQRVKKKQSRTSFLVSIGLHILLVLAVFLLAAREGLFGKKLKEITAVVVPEEKKKPEPQKPKEEPKPEPLKQQAKTEAPKVAAVPAPVTSAAPPPATTAAAPPPSIGADFDFNDGRVKQTDEKADPITLYRQSVEYAFRSRWQKPDGMDDTALVVEADVSVASDGSVTAVDWKRGSGDPKWDASVREALGQTKNIGRKPPKDFPGRFLVRFDAVPDTEPVQ
jgi:TonB C terminal